MSRHLRDGHGVVQTHLREGHWWNVFGKGVLEVGGTICASAADVASNSGSHS